MRNTTNRRRDAREVRARIDAFIGNRQQASDDEDAATPEPIPTDRLFRVLAVRLRVRKLLSLRYPASDF
jgi:hypothetical protein